MIAVTIEDMSPALSQDSHSLYVHFYGPIFFMNSLKIATRICQVSQYLGTKLDMQFERAKSVEIVIILGKKQLFYPKILDLTQKHYVATFANKNLQIQHYSAYGSLRCLFGYKATFRIIFE